MSSAIKAQLQGYSIEAKALLEKKIPDAPGATATPNQLQRQYYRAKQICDELKTLRYRIYDAQDKANEFIYKAAATQKEQYQNSFAEWSNSLGIPKTLQDLADQVNLWEVRIELLEDRVNADISALFVTPKSEENKPVKRMSRPQIKLRTFSGLIEEWLPFWDTFRALVHDDHSLTKIERFNLLESNLEGSALELIAGIGISEDGYDTAIDLLLKKFGDDQKLIRALNQELLGLPSSESVDDDEKLFLRIEKLCRQLAALKQDVKAAPYYMNLEGKLSSAVLDKYFSIKDVEDHNDWNTEKFRNAFERALNQIKSRQDAKNPFKAGSSMQKEHKIEPTMNFAVQYEQNKQSQSRERDKSPTNRSFQGRGRSPSPNANRGRTNSPNSQSIPPRSGSPYPVRGRNNSGGSRERTRSPHNGKCVFCEEAHSSINCPNYKGAYERRNRAFVLELCLYCLFKGHFASQCNAPIRECIFCKRTSHHSALCREKFKQASSPERRNTSPKRSSSPNSNQKGVSAPTTENLTAGNCSELNLFCPNKNCEVENKIASSCIADPTSKMSILKIIPATIYNPLKPELKRDEWIFLDDGSQKTYIENNLAKELQLDVLGTKKFQLSGIDQKPLGVYEEPIVEFGVCAKKFDMLFKARTLNSILGKIPIFSTKNIPKEQLLRNKLITQLVEGQPKLVIGNDYYNFLGVRPIRQYPSGIWLSETNLGPVINGEGKVQFIYEKGKRSINASLIENKIESNSKFSSSLPTFSITSSSLLDENHKLETQMENLEDVSVKEENFYELIKMHDSLQNIGLSDALIKDKELMEMMESKISFNGNRYQTKLCWNNELAARLPTYYDLAYSQLKSNLNRMRKMPEMLKIYHETILEQIKRGMIEKVEPLVDKYTPGRKINYLPHHAVIREDKEHTRLRVVYNASASRRGEPSLNQCLEKGPNLYNDLCGILLRSRLEKILIASDIEKAFHQIELDPEDRNCVRFLWAENPFEENSPILEYRFKVVTFGVICSPAHLALVLSLHLRKYESDFAKKVARNAYVDNLVYLVQNSNEVEKVYKEMKSIFNDAGMNVREFVSNAVEEIKKLPQADRIDKDVVKFLGVEWNVVRDTFLVKLPKWMPENKVTRRTILSQTAKPFDPAGFAAPSILKAKLFRQEIEKNKRLSWDDSLSKEMSEKWQKLMKEWDDVQFVVPRFLEISDGSTNTHYELHAFSDASASAFGAAIYLRIIKGEKIANDLIFGKSLVIPSTLPEKRRTVPNLELHGAMLCCKYIKFVREQLEKEIKIEKVRLWTDSTDVVDFLLSEKKFDRFVKNRINKIREFPTSHVDGKMNPADCASRGVSPKELNESKIWWKGPEFLEKPEKLWPKSLKEFDPHKIIEPKKVPNPISISLAVRSNKIEPIFGSCINVERFSNYNRLKNAVAYSLRVFNGRQNNNNLKLALAEARKEGGSERIKSLISNCRPLEVRETSRAELILLLNAQSEFPPQKHDYKNLNLYKDEVGLWRTQRRIKNSGFDHDTTNPIFLNYKAIISGLLVRQAHLDTMHGGPSEIIAKIRQKYWITRLRALIDSFLRRNNYTKCGVCTRLSAKPYEYPNPPPLPDFRVKGEEAFSQVGLDYFGPFNVKGLENTKKCWGAIFTCCLSRAVHLELVTDCSSEKFLLAFTRFIRRRRVPKIIVSDNASTFVLANKALNDFQEEEFKQKKMWFDTFSSKIVRDFSVKNEISWHFITPLSPWMGGFYERLIQSVKRHLYRVIGKKAILFEELLTYVIEVERILNERPLTYLSENEVINPLRPIDILSPNESLETKLSLLFEEEDDEYKPIKSSRNKLLEAHKYSLNRAHKFWSRWREEYLLNLREVYTNKLKLGQKFPKLNQIVLVQDGEKCPRSMWPLGKIEEILSDRKVRVKIGNKVLERPNTLLYPLEIEDLDRTGLDQENQNDSMEKLMVNSTFEFSDMNRRQQRAIGEEFESNQREFDPDNSDWEPVEARSTNVIVTDRQPDLLRSMLRQMEVRCMVFEPPTWQSLFGQQIIIADSVQNLFVWQQNTSIQQMNGIVRTMNRLFARDKMCVWVLPARMANNNDWSHIPNIVLLEEPENFNIFFQMIQEDLGIHWEPRLYNEQAREQNRLAAQQRGRERVFIRGNRNLARRQFVGRGRPTNRPVPPVQQPFVARQPIRQNQPFGARRQNFGNGNSRGPNRKRRFLVEPQRSGDEDLQQNANDGAQQMDGDMLAANMETISLNEEQMAEEQMAEEKGLKKDENSEKPVSGELEEKIGHVSDGKVEIDVPFDASLEEAQKLIKWPSILDEKIDAYANKLTPEPALVQAKIKEFENLCRFIKEKWSPNSRVFLFGSSITGLVQVNSDLDITIYDSEDQTREKITNNLKAIKNLANIEFEIKKPTIRFGARVPILDFEIEKEFGLVQIQISMNNATGVLNSKFIGVCAMFCPQLKSLYFLTKFWAKSYGIMDSSDGTLSSYSSLLLLIFYLQKIEHLPNILEKVPELFEIEGLTLTLEQTQKFVRRLVGINLKSTPISVLWSGFIDFYNAVDFKHMGLSIRRNIIYERNEDKNKRKPLEIEEPITGKNATLFVSELGLTKIILTIRKTFENLQFGLPKEADILNIIGMNLVPEIAQKKARLSANDKNNVSVSTENGEKMDGAAKANASDGEEMDGTTKSVDETMVLEMDGAATTEMSKEEEEKAEKMIDEESTTGSFCTALSDDSFEHIEHEHTEQTESLDVAAVGESGPSF